MRSRHLTPEEIAGSSASGWTRIVALVAAVSLVAAWLGVPGLVFHASSISEWLMPLVQ